MSFGIGDRVEIITDVFLGRWIYPGEGGEIVARNCSPAGQETYRVKLGDGETFTFVPGEIKSVSPFLPTQS